MKAARERHWWSCASKRKSVETDSDEFAWGNQSGGAESFRCEFLTGDCDSLFLFGGCRGRGRRRSGDLGGRRSRNIVALRTLRSRRSTLACVIVDIPAGAFELQGGHGQRTFQGSLALRTALHRLIIKALNLLKAVATLGTDIGIQRQVNSPHREVKPHPIIVTGKEQISCA